MTIAMNKDGSIVSLDSSGEWVPAKIAQNPATGESLVFDDGRWVPLNAKPKPVPGDYGFQESLAHGMTLGALEEVGAAGRTAGAALRAITDNKWDDFSVSGTWKKKLAELAAERAGYKKESPILSNIGEITGGFLTAGPAAYKAISSGRKYAPGIMNKIKSGFGTAGRGGAVGAGIGGISGGLESNKDRLGGLVFGGGIGASIGLSVPAITKIVGKIGVPAWEGIVSRFGTGARTIGFRKLAQNLADDNITPKQFYDEIRKLGPDAVPADAGGRNVSGFVEDLAQSPGKSIDEAAVNLANRQKGAHSRVVGASKEALGVRGNLFEKVSGAFKKRAKAAQKYYDRSNNIDPAELDTPEIRKFLKNDAVKEAYEGARKIAGVKGVKLPDLYAVADDGTSILRARPDMRTLDYIKRSLDDEVSKAYRAGNGELGSALRGLRDGFRGALDNINPNYKMARSIYAGDSAVIEAMESGRAFMRGDADEVLAAFARATKTEKQAFREGVMREIRAKAEKPGDHINVARNIYNSPENRRLLHSIIGDKQFGKWSAAMEREIKFAQTNQMRFGSPTARREAFRDDAQFDPTPLIQMKVDPTAGSINLARQLAKWAKRPNRDISNEMAQYLFSTNPAKKREMIAKLLQSEKFTLPGRGVIGNNLIGGGSAGVPMLSGPRR
tara:strand:+ start:1197 stop:3206 length:2010 start_codon:yes stop_codon:yes gene_type:complete